MAMRISRALKFLVPVTLLSLLWMGNSASIQAQPIVWEVLSSTPKQTIAKTDRQQLIRTSVLSATNYLTSTAQSQKQTPKADVLGNGGIEVRIKPSKVIETESAKLVYSCDSPVSENIGLTWDGSYLWISDWNTKRAYQVDPSTCSSLHSIPLPGTYPTGLAWDGDYLWHADADSKTIYQLDPSLGTIVSSFSSPGEFPVGLTWDGINIWNSDTGCDWEPCTPDEIHKLTTTGSVLATFAAIGPAPTGLAYGGYSLWHSDNVNSTIYKLNPADLSILDSFPSPGMFPNDLAWDGQYLWVVDNGTDMLYQYDVGYTRFYLPLIMK